MCPSLEIILTLQADLDNCGYSPSGGDCSPRGATIRVIRQSCDQLREELGKLSDDRARLRLLLHSALMYTEHDPVCLEFKECTCGCAELEAEIGKALEGHDAETDPKT